MDDEDSLDSLTSFMLRGGWLALFSGATGTALLIALHVSSRWLDDSMVPSVKVWIVPLMALVAGYLLYEGGRRSRHFSGREGELARLSGDRWLGPLPWRKGELPQLLAGVAWASAVTTTCVGGAITLLAFASAYGSHVPWIVGTSALGVGFCFLLLAAWIRQVVADRR